MSTLNVPTRFARFVAVLMLAGVFVACDSGSETPDTPSLDTSFELSITGQGVDETYTGNAYFGEIQDSDGKQAFAVTLQVLSSSEAITGFLHRAGSRPSSGTYAIADIDDATAVSQSTFIFYVVDATDTVTDAYVANGGQVTLSESTGDTVRGELSIPATRIENSQSGTTRTSVQIDASFTAVNNPGAAQI